MVLQLPDAATDAADKLTREMNDAPTLTKREAKRRYREFTRKAHDRILNDGVSYHDAVETPRMYLTEDRETFDRKLRMTDNDLVWQCETVSAAFRRYQRTGETPAPYFALRVAIVLRKAREHARERKFLAAWCRHFRRHVGGKYTTLVERYAKLRT